MKMTRAFGIVAALLVAMLTTATISKAECGLILPMQGLDEHQKKAQASLDEDRKRAWVSFVEAHHTADQACGNARHRNVGITLTGGRQLHERHRADVGEHSDNH